ncbi:hypothetical protein PIB30_040575 [Stylosanthes scabra]|uniref:Sugar phosphate transporter domain-containing protein n=1 Tax=Stylosanthes scabra TaxID=79078 RepID=A0ABU6YDM3_9FABA|nr:hypothetical protein [Stylosanthes scabra]
MSSSFQLGVIGALFLSVASSVSIVICNKALMTSFGFPFATTLTSWHMVVTFGTLYAAKRLKFFEAKAIDMKTVILFGILNGVSVGFLNLSLGFNSIGFYQMTKLAIIPFTVLLETIFLKKEFREKSQPLRRPSLCQHHHHLRRHPGPGSSSHRRPLFLRIFSLQTRNHCSSHGVLLPSRPPSYVTCLGAHFVKPTLLDWCSSRRPGVGYFLVLLILYKMFPIFVARLPYVHCVHYFLVLLILCKKMFIPIEHQ